MAANGQYRQNQQQLQQHHHHRWCSFLMMAKYVYFMLIILLLRVSLPKCPVWIHTMHTYIYILGMIIWFQHLAFFFFLHRAHPNERERPTAHHPWKYSLFLVHTLYTVHSTYSHNKWLYAINDVSLIGQLQYYYCYYYHVF